MSGPAIINIINFIRAVEPRCQVDLVEPVAKQLQLVRKHGLPATWLLQYDALIDKRFTDLLPLKDKRHEIGIWFEVVQPLVEDAGLVWRGRYPWDWHCDVGFSIGYTPKEREKLVDVCMERFRRHYGHYPRCVGSWFMDAHLLGYLSDRYHIVAACNCRDQWGTDGYTLWGGYYSQAYYPSRLNAYMPAQNAKQQIPVPVFRMLGSDPIYQYDYSLGENGQGVVTLEPVYQKEGGGGDPKWVRWFFDVNSFAPSLAFSYAQVGQENSFSWPAMAKGLTDQVEYLSTLKKDKRVRIETMADSGAWFRSSFPVTPATSVTALTDWRKRGRKSVWYNSHAYRVNLYWDGPRFRIRDIHCFDESYAERYLTDSCSTPSCTYDVPPLVDGFRWSDAKAMAGLYLEDDRGNELKTDGNPPVVVESGSVLTVRCQLTDGSTLTIHCEPEQLAIQCAHSGWRLRVRHAAGAVLPFAGVDGNTLWCLYAGHSYAVTCSRGLVGLESGVPVFAPESGVITLMMKQDDLPQKKGDV